jgi:cytochrome c oxidase cbb3-type subunit 3/ubiquinol-cytochrome c reductase cytochrome c subunit
MNLRSLTSMSMACACALAMAGCWSAPGKPGPGIEVPRPEQVLDFATLYKENCAACHGDNGHNGASISLSNPVYLAATNAVNIQQITSAGVPGTLMPGFGKSAGGMLTDRQIAVIANGMYATWSKPSVLAGATPPPYANHLQADPSHGPAAFATYCARCHGSDGTGSAAGNLKTGSLVDPAYLSLISQQALRSTIIAGKPDQGMPDWRNQATGPQAHAIGDREITDIVAWLYSHRSASPGQPYPEHP